MKISWWIPWDTEIRQLTVLYPLRTLIHCDGQARLLPACTKNKANLWLINAVVKGMNTKWLNHSLSIATKDVWVLKDSIQKDVITIVALKSAETGWNINTFNREYFMIDECKAPLYAVPYFINGSVYVICIIPSFQIVGNEVRPVIDRKILYEDILKPLMNKVFL